MSKKQPDIDWSSIHDKVEDMLGVHFLNDLQSMLPKRFPNIDLYQTDTEGIVVIEIPGLQSSQDIRIKLESSMLTIDGQIPYSYPITKQQLTMKERHTGSFQRTIRIPFPYIDDQISAKYKNGLLEIRLQKDIQDQTISIEFDEEN
ncbi:Hsp20/alpha crystallin family protein [Metabacillus iocasae]|uniref:HSP20 family protein n=1 Tax=Priestia iocasae TaxID=2291674 RepID=A0ABS2QS29_9BACI|nr:Hsp20/alpha crystallin family protein [Metabacillus iocasae]MBM7702018.1 HSP20 family protein [Metabacillus iocasae]